MISVNIVKQEKDGGKIYIEFDSNRMVSISTKDFPKFTLDEMFSLHNEIAKTIKQLHFYEVIYEKHFV